MLKTITHKPTAPSSTSVALHGRPYHGVIRPGQQERASAVPRHCVHTARMALREEGEGEEKGEVERTEGEEEEEVEEEEEEEEEGVTAVGG